MARMRILAALVAAVALVVRPTNGATDISVNKSCFERGESLTIDFETDNPTIRDWMAIVPPSTETDPFGAHVVTQWIGTCGRHVCSGAPLSSGQITLTPFVPNGDWVVVLITEGPHDWLGVASSDVFEIRSSNGCPGAGVAPTPPTAQPVVSSPQPVAAPTPPTPSPTKSLSLSSKDTVSLDKSVYWAGENIVVSFSNKDPRPDDWVAIYFDSIPPDQLFRGEFWMWACGGQSGQGCQSPISDGEVEFSSASNVDWDQDWPLLDGTYRAFLLRDTEAPFEVIAWSETFTVRSPESPTSAPTASSFIATDSQSYFAGEDIVVSFVNGEPEQGDWVGIFRVSAPSNNLRTGEMWQWICSGQGSGCGSLVSDGTLVFGEDFDVNWRQRWPLRGGEYRAVLSRDIGPPWPVIEESATFEIIDFRTKIEAAADDIADLISDNRALGPKFLRLGFHDCVGGCDGCVDLENPSNFGLDIPIEALESVVQDHEDLALGFSRADIWALAALVGADVSQRRPLVDFSLETIGRINCEDAGNPCLDFDNEVTPCTPERGPHRELPLADITTADLFHFFSSEFGFNVQETVALMGAHTIGVLTRENSGFDGQDGWVVDDLVLDNDYYFELVGNPNPNVPFELQIDLAPPWFRDFEDNSDVDMPDRHVWAAFPQGQGGQRILMLNADIALVRNLTNDNMASDGEVSCAFIDENRCPHAADSLDFAAEYRLDNELWLNDFSDVLKRMVNAGYSVTNECILDVCILEAS